MTDPDAASAPATAPPRRPVPQAALDRLAERGGGPAPLYEALAHSEPLLLAWIDFAWTLRAACVTDRRIRELLILRSAQVHACSYQWRDHVAMAERAGVPAEQVEELAALPQSALFDDRERAVLGFAEQVFAGDVEDGAWRRLRTHFSDQECQELLMTAGFYAMVPRVVKAMRLDDGTRTREDG